MSDFVVLGTDTDVGKTTFALLWLTAFADKYAYWKPIETGPSDTETVRRLVPVAQVNPPLTHFEEPVAPPLAAKRLGKTIPLALAIADHKPHGDRPLLIETFGGPLSPLNESELQIELIRRLNCPCVLVSSSRIGAVGRTLSTLRVLVSEGLSVTAVVLIGPRDEYAETEITKHSDMPTMGLDGPAAWDSASLRASAELQRKPLLELARILVERQSPTGPSPQLLLATDRDLIWHPYTPLRGSDEPLPVVAAQHEFLELADGRRIIDGVSSWWTILHGHRSPRLMAALQRAADRIDHVMFAGVTHPFAVECAELLMRTAPWPDGRVFFSDNGSTAVEVALKMAYQFWCHRGEPQRRLFVGLEGGYHGDTFGAMAVSRDPLFFGRFEPLLFETLRVPASPAEELKELLARRGSDVAAVIVEPLVQGAGGMRMYSAEILRDLFSVCREHGVLFIADEVMTAGRTGSFWAHTQAGIAPDLICAAKTLAGGAMPLAATLASPGVVAEFDVDDRAKTFFHGHSFTAHPLACAVAVENLRLMADGKWLEDSDRINRRWERDTEQLRPLRGVTDVRVCGTILALDLEAEGGYLAEIGPRMRAEAIAKGVLLRPLGNVLYAMPPLCTSDDSLANIIDAIKSAADAAR